MAQAEIRLGLRATGADLRVIADELARMDAGTVTRIFRRHLDDAAKPVVPAVRASALAIPVKGKKTTGLRARIAACVTSTSWADPSHRQAGASVWVNPHRMEPDYTSLPLYMEGTKPRWRHPVYGKRDNPNDWQPQAAHPYFYQAASRLGPRAGEALRRALEDITRQLGGR